jgi:hypothetical protein
LSGTTSGRDTDRLRGATFITLSVAALTVLLLELAVRREVVPAPAAEGGKPEAAQAGRFVDLPYDPLTPVAPIEGRPQVLVLGNSHLYSLPSPTPGHAMRVAQRGILPDLIGAELSERRRDSPQVYLLAYPNFVPYEMFTRWVGLRQSGFRPDTVVLGLTWRNVARDSALRQQIYQAYRDPTFGTAMKESLARLPAAEADMLRPAVENELRRAEFDAQVERMKSHADRLDERLHSQAKRYSALVGESEEIRSRLFRLLNSRVQKLWAERKTAEFQYDLIEEDYRLNLPCLQALLLELRGVGTQIVLYYAPERGDLPPVMNPARQAEFVQMFDAWCRTQGVLVVDARKVVPNEYWGYDFDSADRSHFTEEGHRRLTRFLIDEVERLRPGFWKGDAAP